MPRGPRARAVLIPLLERPRLRDLASSRCAPFEEVRRARAILLLGAGVSVAETARGVGWSDRTVRKWRARWDAVPRAESLKDRDRSGRPRRITAETRCDVIQLACDAPDKLLTPFRDTWTQAALAVAVKLRTKVEISRSSVQRILSAEGLKPHRVRPWLHSPDPDFRAKVARICALYRNPPEDAVVLCVDEKPLQALERRFVDTRGADGVVRRDFEYRRHGIGHLLAAYNVRTGEVTSQVVDSRDAASLVAFMSSVARRYRGKRIIVVWDNLNIHFDGKDERWSRFNAHRGGRFEFVYTPLHASWVNQVELWFSVLQRRVIRNGSFDHRGRIRSEVEAFVRYWNLYEKKPFRWTFDGRFEQPQRSAA